MKRQNLRTILGLACMLAACGSPRTSQPKAAADVIDASEADGQIIVTCRSKIDPDASYQETYVSEEKYGEAYENGTVCESGGSKNFLFHCKDSDATPETQLLVSALKSNVNAMDCDGAFAKLKTVSRLILSEKGLSNLAALEGLDNVRQLYIHKNQIKDIGILKRLPALKEVNISDNPITDFSALEGLGLEVLSLGSRSIRASTAPLGTLAKLKHLNILGPSAQDLAFLAQTPQLIRFSVQDGPVSDLAPLKGLSKLENLSLNGTQVKDASPLASLNALIYLSIVNSPLGTTLPKSPGNCPTDKGSKALQDWCRLP